MKRIIILFGLVFPMFMQAQTNGTLDSLIHEVHELRKELHEADSINKLYLNSICNNAITPRYKMYQTENIYNLLKLDTKTGSVWQVQYRTNSEGSITVPIEYGYSVGVIPENLGWDGRYELYPTQNIHTFILLDTATGATYQVQWSTKSNNRFMERLW